MLKKFDVLLKWIKVDICHIPPPYLEALGLALRVEEVSPLIRVLDLNEEGLCTLFCLATAAAIKTNNFEIFRNWESTLKKAMVN